MSKKIVIVSGGELEESFVLSELETLDSQFIIGVDKGMEFLYHQRYFQVILLEISTV